MSQPEFQVLIRAAGERTAEACEQLVSRQTETPPIVIREQPFSRAVTRTMEVGAACGADYVIAIDADVLVLSDFSRRIREMCRRLPGNAFSATTLVHCKVMGGFVFRGVHIYRGSLLEQAFEIAQDLPPTLRPESAVQNAMESLGHPKHFLAHATGVHDHQQFFWHLYLKAKLRARKDEDAMSIRRNLKARSPRDPDALVSLWGFDDALSESSPPVEYDWNTDQSELHRRLADAGLQERSPLPPGGMERLAEKILNNHDYRNDRISAPWIRDHLAFDDGAPAIVNGLFR